MIDTPLVSVIIPTYGRAAFLEEAIGSVVAQTYPAIELIVVDDASDPSVQLPDEIDAVLLRHARNMGPGAARNTGLAHATGDLLLFLDDDDLLTPYRIALAVEQLGDARAHAARIEWLHPDGRVQSVPDVFRGDLRSTFQLPKYPAMGQVVHRREDVLQFDPTLRTSEDEEWCIRMADRAIYAWSDEIGLRVRRHLDERLGVDPTVRYRTRLQVLRRHEPVIDRRARAHLRSYVAAAALNSGYRLAAAKWSLLSLTDRPTSLGAKRLVRSLIGGQG